MSHEIGLSVGGRDFAARTFGSEPTAIVRALAGNSFQCVQDEWSGGLLKSLQTGVVGDGIVTAEATRFTYQYAGLLGYEPVSGRVTLAYGDAKSQIAESLRPVVPLAVVEAELDELVKLCHAAQFTGAVKVAIGAQAAPRPASARPPADLVASLGDVSAPMAFHADADPALVGAIRELLPMSGTATNTHSGGPLTRFWNILGGTEGETPLPLAEAATLTHVLRPGHMYYLPKPPWRGFRLALREPTIMRSAVAGGANTLAPVAVVLAGLEDLSRLAARLSVTGRVPMRFEAA